MTWTKIVVIGIFITMSIVTVAICDIAIIKEIRQLRNTMQEFIIYVE